MLAMVVYWTNLDDYFIGDDFDLILSFHDKPLGYFVSLLWSNESGSVWKEWGLDRDLGTGYLRPVKIWLLALDHSLWNVNSTGYHVTSTLLFGCVIYLVFRITRVILPARPEIAVFASVCVAIHPVFAEIVPFITAREEVLALSFTLASLLALIAYRERGRSPYWFLLFFVLAILSKESGIIALPLAVCWDMVFGKLRPMDPASRRDALRLYGPIVCWLVVYFGLRWVAIGNFVGGDGSARFGSPRAFLDFHLLFWRSLFLPDLFSAGSVPNAGLVVGILGIVAIVGALTSGASSETVRRIFYFGPVWYLCCTLLLYGTYFSHRHHAPLIVGLIVFTALVIAALSSSASRRVQLAVAMGGILVSAAAFVPPTRAMAIRFDRASEVVRAIRIRIEDATRDLPPGSRVRLSRVPQSTSPPYFFGWGLLSALQRPFTETDLAKHSVVFNPHNRKLTRSKDVPPESFDLTLDLGAPVP